jgi:hypothetical protein
MCEEMNIVKLPKIGGRDSRLLTARSQLGYTGGSSTDHSNRDKKESKGILFTLSSINEKQAVAVAAASGGSNGSNHGLKQKQPGGNSSRFLTIP